MELKAIKGVQVPKKPEHEEIGPSEAWNVLKNVLLDSIDCKEMPCEECIMEPVCRYVYAHDVANTKSEKMANLKRVVEAVTETLGYIEMNEEE